MPLSAKLSFLILGMPGRCALDALPVRKTRAALKAHLQQGRGAPSAHFIAQPLLCLHLGFFSVLVIFVVVVAYT